MTFSLPIGLSRFYSTRPNLASQLSSMTPPSRTQITRTGSSRESMRESRLATSTRSRTHRQSRHPQARHVHADSGRVFLPGRRYQLFRVRPGLVRLLGERPRCHGRDPPDGELLLLVRVVGVPELLAFRPQVLGSGVGGRPGDWDAGPGNSIEPLRGEAGVDDVRVDDQDALVPVDERVGAVVARCNPGLELVRSVMPALYSRAKAGMSSVRRSFRVAAANEAICFACAAAMPTISARGGVMSTKGTSRAKRQPSDAGRLLPCCDPPAGCPP